MVWKQYPEAAMRGDENGNVEELIGNVWTRVITGGAKNVESQASSVWSYGGWPANYFLTTDLPTSAATDNVLVATALNLQPYSYHTIILTAGGADIEVTLDGTNWTSAGAVLVADTSTAEAGGGYDFVATMAADTLYILRAKVYGLRVRTTGAAATAGTLVSGVM